MYYVCVCVCLSHLFENHKLIQEVDTLTGEELPDGFMALKALRRRGGTHLEGLVPQELGHRVFLKKKENHWTDRERKHNWKTEHKREECTFIFRTVFYTWWSLAGNFKVTTRCPIVPTDKCQCLFIFVLTLHLMSYSLEIQVLHWAEEAASSSFFLLQSCFFWANVKHWNLFELGIWISWLFKCCSAYAINAVIYTGGLCRWFFLHCRQNLFLTLYFWKSLFLQSWICTAERHFSILDTAPVCNFPLVWKTTENCWPNGNEELKSWSANQQDLQYIWSPI